ncbi:Abi family protein [Enterococcus mundtii]|uniref:Abi family protein n=1 Tax=Enterococcus mundtii TaxID=53346 RepID=UPI001883FF65|nr:Abi family protein [Enterococcus mundtii]MBE9909972.1 Abi family protein [Enterococcus mundtii]
MGIKPRKDIGQLISTLKTRNLSISDSAEKFLMDINYFQLINGIENLLLPLEKSKTNGIKQFKTETMDDFIAIYNFDREFSNKIMQIISRFEMRLKTSVSYNFSKKYCYTINRTMEYTNKNNYVNLSTEKNYPFRSYDNDPVKYQYESICYKFNRFKLFDKNFLNNLVRNNDFIDKSFYRDNNYYPVNPSDVCVFTEDNKVAVPLWVAIQTFDFGCLKRMCHYMKIKDFNLVLKDFGLEPIDRIFFLNCLDIIHELRNACAHFSLLFRFKTPSNLGISKGLIKKFNLKPQKTKHPAVKISLYDCLKVLAFFESLKDLKKPLKKIIYRNNRKFNSKYYDLNHRLLTEIGEPSYKEIKKLFR